MGALKFETVNALPLAPEPGVVYFVKRADGDLDTYVTSKDGLAVLQRSGHVQMHIEALPPGLLPADTVIGRYYATEALRMLADLCGVRADTGATNESAIRVMSGDDVIATATFVPAATIAVIDILEPDVPAFSILTFMTPVDQDPTLEGVVGTFVAQRT